MKTHIIINCISKQYGLLMSCLQSIYEQDYWADSITILLPSSCKEYDRIFDIAEFRACNTMKYSPPIDIAGILWGIGKARQEDMFVILQDNFCFTEFSSLKEILQARGEKTMMPITSDHRNIICRSNALYELNLHSPCPPHCLHFAFQYFSLNRIPSDPSIRDLFKVHKFKMILTDDEKLGITQSNFATDGQPEEIAIKNFL